MGRQPPASFNSHSLVQEDTYHPRSGRSSLTSTASTPLAPTLELQTCSLRGSMCTTTKLLVPSMSLEQSLWTSSLGPWILSGVDLLDRFSGQTTSCSDRVALETTGPRAITLREPSWWTASSTW